MVVAGTLLFESVQQVVFLGLLAVKGALKLALLILKAVSLVTSLQQVVVGHVVGLSGLLEVVVFVLADLGEFLSLFLQSEQFALGGLHTLVSLAVLTLLVAVSGAETVDFLLVAATFLLKLVQLEGGGVDVLAKSIRVVALGLDLTSEAENVSLTAADLLSKGSDFNLHIVIGSALIV